MRYNKKRKKLSYQGWTRQLNRRNQVPKAGKKVREITAPTVSSPAKHLASRYNIYEEGIVQSHSGPMIAFSLMGWRDDSAIEG